MRVRVILLCILCLSAGAFAIEQVLHSHLRVEAVLTLKSFFPSLQAPFAAVDSSPARFLSERNAPAGAESAAQSAKRKSNVAETAQSGGAKLDVARISTSGSSSVFAGRAAPGDLVTVFENGIAVATATANANGDWSLVTEHRFASGDPKISLSAVSPETRTQGNQAPLGNAKPAASIADVESSSISPSVGVLKNFESMVATAREEAQARDQTETTIAAAGAAPSIAPAVSRSATDVSELSPSPETLRDSARLPSATIPVPMTFVFDEATLTPDGEKTARLLLEYLLLKKFSSVTLSGHADERGTADYNMELSRKRLETVSTLLRDGGYQGTMKLLPEGATEPFTGVDRSKFSLDDLMQLDRRVELRNAM